MVIIWATTTFEEGPRNIENMFPVLGQPYCAHANAYVTRVYDICVCPVKVKFLQNSEIWLSLMSQGCQLALTRVGPCARKSRGLILKVVVAKISDREII